MIIFYLICIRLYMPPFTEHILFAIRHILGFPCLSLLASSATPYQTYICQLLGGPRWLYALPHIGLFKTCQSFMCCPRLHCTPPSFDICSFPLFNICSSPTEHISVFIYMLYWPCLPSPPCLTCLPTTALSCVPSSGCSIRPCSAPAMFIWPPFSFYITSHLMYAFVHFGIYLLATGTSSAIILYSLYVTGPLFYIPPTR